VGRKEGNREEGEGVLIGSAGVKEGKTSGVITGENVGPTWA
jgi:hypothetical protein